LRLLLNLSRVSRAHLAGKVAIVTGGGAGIGRAIALRYGEHGAKVAVADVNAETARAIAESVGPGALAVPCALRDHPGQRSIGPDRATRRAVERESMRVTPDTAGSRIPGNRGIREVTRGHQGGGNRVQ